MPREVECMNKQKEIIMKKRKRVVRRRRKEEISRPEDKDVKISDWMNQEILNLTFYRSAKLSIPVEFSRRFWPPKKKNLKKV